MTLAPQPLSWPRPGGPFSKPPGRSRATPRNECILLPLCTAPGTGIGSHQPKLEDRPDEVAVPCGQALTALRGRCLRAADARGFYCAALGLTCDLLLPLFCVPKRRSSLNQTSKKERPQMAGALVSCQITSRRKYLKRLRTSLMVNILLRDTQISLQAAD
jgi:hypothetical protein